MSWLDEHAKSVYSQNGEDGIIEHIFSVIGYESRLFIEFGFSVLQCNSWKLVEDEAFGGLFIDSTDVCAEMEASLARQGRINVWTMKKKLTAENIKETLSVMPDEIDILSIDVDGNDYWLWKAIERISPRLVVIEFNSAIGRELSVTVPYDPDFEWGRSDYFGASLSALEKLGKAKGYKLIGCDPQGINAFFLREDIEGFDTVTAAKAFRCRFPSREAQWDRVKDMEWVTV